MFERKRNNKGFTLIELIVVIAIIAILAAIAVPAFVGLSAQAQTAADTADAKMIAQAINVYNMLNPGTPIAATNGAQATLTTAGLWPVGVTNATTALGMITFTDGVALVQ